MPRGRGQRAGLTRAAVLETARALLAEEGLNGVTMRALALRLGVAPNALYSHVPGKAELIDALLDDRLALVEEPDPGVADPVAALVALLTSTYKVLLARPGLVPLYLARQGSRGPNAVRLGTTMDALLARLGLAAEAIPSARRALIVHAIGGAAFAAAAGPVPAETVRADFARSLRWLLAGMTHGGDADPAPPPLLDIDRSGVSARANPPPVDVEPDP